MDVRRVGDRECIHCAGCMDVCPEKAITIKAGNVSLKPPEGSFGTDGQKKRKSAGRIVWGAALALLAFALLWFNFRVPA
jgi:ferredoxin